MTKPSARQRAHAILGENGSRCGYGVHSHTCDRLTGVLEGSDVESEAARAEMAELRQALRRIAHGGPSFVLKSIARRALETPECPTEPKP